MKIEDLQPRLFEVPAEPRHGRHAPAECPNGS
jgi:hypothetical protein